MGCLFSFADFCFSEVVEATGFKVRTFRIKELEIQFSLDGEHWTPYEEVDGVTKVLTEQIQER